MSECQHEFDCRAQRLDRGPLRLTVFGADVTKPGSSQMPPAEEVVGQDVLWGFSLFLHVKDRKAKERK